MQENVADDVHKYSHTDAGVVLGNGSKHVLVIVYNFKFNSILVSPV